MTGCLHGEVSTLSTSMEILVPCSIATYSSRIVPISSLDRRNMVSSNSSDVMVRYYRAGTAFFVADLVPVGGAAPRGCHIGSGDAAG
jgi:hypothetical protein